MSSTLSCAVTAPETTTAVAAAVAALASALAGDNVGEADTNNTTASASASIEVWFHRHDGTDLVGSAAKVEIVRGSTSNDATTSFDKLIRLDDIRDAVRKRYHRSVGKYDDTELVLLHHNDAANQTASHPKGWDPSSIYDVHVHGGTSGACPIIFRIVAEPVDGHSNATVAQPRVVPITPRLLQPEDEASPASHDSSTSNMNERDGNNDNSATTSDLQANRNGTSTTASGRRRRSGSSSSNEASISSSLRPKRPKTTKATATHKIAVPCGSGHESEPESMAYHQAARSRIAEYIQAKGDVEKRQAIVDDLLSQFDFYHADGSLADESYARSKIVRFIGDRRKLPDATVRGEVVSAAEPIQTNEPQHDLPPNRRRRRRHSKDSLVLVPNNDMSMVGRPNKRTSTSTPVDISAAAKTVVPCGRGRNPVAFTATIELRKVDYEKAKTSKQRASIEDEILTMFDFRRDNESVEKNDARLKVPKSFQRLDDEVSSNEKAESSQSHSTAVSTDRRRMPTRTAAGNSGTTTDLDHSMPNPNEELTTAGTDDSQDRSQQGGKSSPNHAGSNVDVLAQNRPSDHQPPRASKVVVQCGYGFKDKPGNKVFVQTAVSRIPDYLAAKNDSDAQQAMIDDFMERFEFRKENALVDDTVARNKIAALLRDRRRLPTQHPDAVGASSSQPGRTARRAKRLSDQTRVEQGEVDSTLQSHPKTAKEPTQLVQVPPSSATIQNAHETSVGFGSSSSSAATTTSRTSQLPSSSPTLEAAPTNALPTDGSKKQKIIVQCVGSGSDDHCDPGNVAFFQEAVPRLAAYHTLHANHDPNGAQRNAILDELLERFELYKGNALVRGIVAARKEIAALLQNHQSRLLQKHRRSSGSTSTTMPSPHGHTRAASTQAAPVAVNGQEVSEKNHDGIPTSTGGNTKKVSFSSQMASADITDAAVTTTTGSNDSSTKQSGILVGSSSSSSQGRATILEHDVLLGRGRGTYNHSGNRRFRTLVAENHREYLKAHKGDKVVIALRIVSLIQSQGGRFLTRGAAADDDGSWVPVTDKRAQEKTSQALRAVSLDVRNNNIGDTSDEVLKSSANVGGREVSTVVVASPVAPVKDAQYSQEYRQATQPSLPDRMEL